MAIEFRGASQAAVEQPTAGTQPRTELSMPNFGAAISSFVEAGGRFLQQRDEQEAIGLEAEAALGRIESSLDAQGETTAFIQTDEDARTQAMLDAIQQDTGIQVGEGDREILKMAAAAGKRYNELAGRGPDAARTANIRKARELQSLISQRPEFAREFRSLIWGNNSFLDDIGADVDREAVAQQERFVEATTRVRNQMIDAGIHEAAMLEPGQVLPYAEQVGFTGQMRRVEAASAAAKEAKARQQQGEAVDHNDLRRTIREGMPGRVAGTMARLNEIYENRDDQFENTTAQLNAIDTAVAQARAQLQEDHPTMTRDQFNSYFGNILQDIPELYRNRISGGREADEANAQLSLLQAANRLDLEREFNVSSMETAARIMSDLEPLGILQNASKLRDANFTNELVRLYTHVTQNPGEVPPPPRVDPDADPRDLAEQQEGFNRWTEEWLEQWDNAPPNIRRALIGNVTAGLERATGQSRVPVMDKMLAYTAKPEFRDVVNSEEWQEMDVKWERRFTQYLEDLDHSVSTVLDDLDGQVDPALDEDGVLLLQAQAGVPRAKVNALARVERRLQNAIRANAHLTGVSYEQSTRDFVNTYLR